MNNFPKIPGNIRIKKSYQKHFESKTCLFLFKILYHPWLIIKSKEESRIARMFSRVFFLLSFLLNNFGYLFFTSVSCKNSILYFASIIFQKKVRDHRCPQIRTKTLPSQGVLPIFHVFCTDLCINCTSFF